MEHIWNVQLTEEEKAELIPAEFDDKDLLTDFDYLHGGDYIERQSPNDSRLYYILFFDEHCCAWQLLYSHNGNSFGLNCISRNTSNFGEVWRDMLERVNTEYDEDNPLVQETIIDKEHQSVSVFYYHRPE